MTTPTTRSRHAPARILKSPLAVPGYSAHPGATAAVSAFAVAGQARLSEREATLAGTGTFDMIYGSRAYFGHTTGPDGCQWWFARLPAPQLDAPELDAPELLREHIATAFDTDATPAAQIIRATQEPITLTTACDIPALPAWHNEQMVLTGDAAHAVSPATTQGASLAAEDAVTLARCLRNIPGIPDALATYERPRRDRAERIVQTGPDTGTNPVPPAPDTPKQGPPAWIFDHHIDWDAPVYTPTTR